MKKLIIAITTALSFSVFAQDTFTKTSWKPFDNTVVYSPLEFANKVTTNSTFYKDSKTKFVNSFEGFVRYKVGPTYVYHLFVIECDRHVVSLWPQDFQNVSSPMVSEFINPSHQVWAYRNFFCKN